MSNSYISWFCELNIALYIETALYSEIFSLLLFQILRDIAILVSPLSSVICFRRGDIFIEQKKDGKTARGGSV